MKTIRTRLVAVAAALALSLAGLAGCSLFGEPASTEDLLVRYAANPNNTNYVAHATADLTVTAAGQRIAVPITGEMSFADNAGKGSATVDMTSFSDETRAYDFFAEVQGTSGTVYVTNSSSDSMAWKRAELDLSFEFDIEALVKILSNAKFMRASYQNDDKVCYDLTLPAKDFLDGFLGMGDVAASFGEINQEELDELLGDSKLHVCFDKDCLIRSVSLDLSYAIDDPEILPVRAQLRLDFDVVVDGYGTVKPEDVAIPETVRQTAALSDDPCDLDGITSSYSSTLVHEE